ncbi:mediator of RNA polymerase II transcription subunit 15-like [Drosophila serrata]|uniref:mediator of RNA polymerase II transcription subunit 15-like n=1 Tax=Drosophila serrata TaxID=7274 RepID=UPI000A1D21E9|nr:mediator of RNA polymerase II transcription subunit 15-like [Drosophila serrata]
MSKSPGGSSEAKMQPEISPREPASRPAVAAFTVRSMEWGPSQEKQTQTSPESFSGPAGPPKQKMTENPSARERRPLIEFQAGEEYVVLASHCSAQEQDQNRRICDESDDTALEDQTVEQTGEREIAGRPLNPISRSLLNANALEFHPMAREREREAEQVYSAEEYALQPNESRLKRRRRSQRSNRSMKRWQREQTNSGQVVEIQVPAQGQQLQQRGIQAQRHEQGQGPGVGHGPGVRLGPGVGHGPGAGHSVGQRHNVGQRQTAGQPQTAGQRQIAGQRQTTGQRRQTAGQRQTPEQRQTAAGQRQATGQRHTTGQRQTTGHGLGAEQDAGERRSIEQRQRAGQHQIQSRLALPGRHCRAPTTHQRLHPQQQQQHACPMTQDQLYQDNPMYPVYVGAPPVPTVYGPPTPAPPVYGPPTPAPPVYGPPPASPVYGPPPAPPVYGPPPASQIYGPPPAPPVYMGTSVYAPPPVPSPATVDYVAAPAPLEYVPAPGTVEYVAASPSSNAYGGYVPYPMVQESLVCPYIWAMH